MLLDVLKKTNVLTDECRDELKFELLQRVSRCGSFVLINRLHFHWFLQSETINLDPALAAACSDDVRRLCPNQNPGNAQVRLLFVIPLNVHSLVEHRFLIA